MLRRVPVLCALMFLALTPAALMAQEVFGGWGPTPDSRFLAGRPGNIASECHIGRVFLTYRYSDLRKFNVRDLDNVEPVADAVERGQPDQAILNLFEQQWGPCYSEVRLELQEAALKKCGLGFIWHLTWSVFPGRCNFGGSPFQYKALVVPSGKVIPPHRTLFDVYRIGDGVCLCSTIPIDQLQPADAAAPRLSGTAILNRARLALGKVATIASEAADGVAVPDSQMDFYGQQSLELPDRVDEIGQVVNQSVWAVNFVDTARIRDDPIGDGQDVFTVWVTTDGRVSELKRLQEIGNHLWTEVNAAPAPEKSPTE